MAVTGLVGSLVVDPTAASLGALAALPALASTVPLTATISLPAIISLTATISLPAAVALAAALDRVFAEPPERAHPVVLLGHAIERIDRTWAGSRGAGLAVAIGLPLGAGATAALLVVAGWVVATAVGLSAPGALAVATLVAGWILFTTISLRLLVRTARDVIGLSETAPDRARRALCALVGREAGQLSPAQIRSAAVESAAENLADGLVAPLAAFLGAALVGRAVVDNGVSILIGGPELVSVPGLAFSASGSTATVLLALGAGGAMWLKAVNTLDSMLGYRDNPLGWAPARLDDIAMWLPARICAVVLALAAGDPRALSRARAPARLPSSPNSGWPMATLAALLGVELSKPAHYRLDCGPSLPTVADAQGGTRVVARAGWLAIALSAAAAALVGVSLWF
jgi:adenosylcobinamide-phosphate synthase